MIGRISLLRNPDPEALKPLEFRIHWEGVEPVPKSLGFLTCGQFGYPKPMSIPTFCRLGGRRYSRLGNLRYSFDGRANVAALINAARLNRSWGRGKRGSSDTSPACSVVLPP